jgi:hypothetical protein
MATDWNSDPFKDVRGTRLAELCPPPKHYNLSDIFKELYSSNIASLVPDGTKLMNKIAKSNKKSQ